MLLRVSDRFVARDVLLALRRDDLQFGSEPLHGEIETNLIISFAGGAVRDRRCAVFFRGSDEMLRNERTRESR